MRPAPDNLARPLDAPQDFGVDSLGLPHGDLGADTVVQLGQPPRRVDPLTASDGVTFDTCFARRDQVDVAGRAGQFHF